MENSKVIVLGLGGADFDVLNALIAAGELPNCGALASEGLSGKLETIIHPALPTTFASLTTGLNPGKHGIYDFFQRIPNSYGIAPVNARLLGGTPLWTYLSELGKRVGVINAPITYPPQKVNGFLVTGMGTPDLTCPSTFPPRLADNLRSAVKDYVIDVYERNLSEGEYLQKLLYIFDKRMEATDYLLSRYTDLDFLFVSFSVFDHFHRLFWKYIDPARPQPSSDQATTFRNALKTCYRSLDDLVGQLLLKENEDRLSIIIVSDRGFGPLHKVFYINQWLTELGLLKLKHNSPAETSFLEAVDWAETKAYSYGAFGNLYLNLQGREPHGIVEQGRQAKEVKEFLERQLHQLKVPGEERSIVGQVFRKEDLYSGPRFGEAPDLLVILEDYSCLPVSRTTFGAKDVFALPEEAWPTGTTLAPSGSSRLNGFFLARGPHFSSGVTVEGIGIIDLAPTILHAMGLPVPREMDGKVLECGFEASYLQSTPIRAATPKSRPGNDKARLWGENITIEELERELKRKDLHIAELKEEVNTLNEVIRRFQQGRFMRVARKVQEIRNKIFGSQG